ncbi:ABC transporter permease [Opitutus terrae]|uniref:Transport permease protein n=1 Tax=Opitutus terrae (strain DSM 11246 / JCM 15787 / PB90-1) TaxID=452637 RepID=B1ZW38_OPITP|nr:ABC transporter permease [Opitutus terrae]ACB76052.1 ABC-2 type transporter [Opitutus terrae PB90-1]
MNPPVMRGEVILEAGQGEAHYWRDLWRYRELLGFLAWRDIKVRYKQATLGAAWALFQPIVTMVIFTFVFGRLAKMPDGGVPYPVLVLAGLLPWQLFSASLSGASGSLVGNSHLISKVYFPRLVIPISAIGVALVDFAIVLGLFVVVSLWFGVVPTWHWLMLPVFIALTLLLALGAGLWLTSLTVKFRDFRFIVPFLLQVGVFVSPVGYRTDHFANWRAVLALNPLTGVIDGYRWCLLGGRQTLDPLALEYAVILTAILVLTGLWYFRRTERQFADII